MRRVGWACERADGARSAMPRGVYEALAPLTCARCRRRIAVDARFTRRRLPRGGIANVCRACAPFDEP
jgi:hypothetical protein